MKTQVKLNLGWTPTFITSPAIAAKLIELLNHPDTTRINVAGLQTVDGWETHLVLDTTTPISVVGFEGKPLTDAEFKSLKEEAERQRREVADAA